MCESIAVRRSSLLDGSLTVSGSRSVCLLAAAAVAVVEVLGLKWGA